MRKRGRKISRKKIYKGSTNDLLGPLYIRKGRASLKGAGRRKGEGNIRGSSKKETLDKKTFDHGLEKREP